MKKYLVLTKDNKLYLNILFLIVAISSYYINNIFVSLPIFIIIVIYSMYINKGFINIFLKKIKK